MVVKSEQAFPIQVRSMVEHRYDAIAKTLSKNIPADRFIQVALLTATKRTDLWECSPESMLLAIMESARAGLYIDNIEATIIPYKGQAQFMPMIQGIIRLMLRAPKVLKMEARCVYEGDDLEYQYGLSPRLDHVPRVIPSDETLTHAYAIIWKEGTDPQFEIMTREEIEIVRLLSRAKSGPWDTYYGEMSRKSVGKRISKYVDLSREAQRAIAIDHELFGDPAMQGYIDGLSDESRNAQVKLDTETRLQELKEEMEAGEGDGAAEEPPPGATYVTPGPDAEAASLDDALSHTSVETTVLGGKPEVIEEPESDEPTAGDIMSWINQRVTVNKGKQKVESLVTLVRTLLGECFEGREDANADKMRFVLAVFGKASGNDLTGAELVSVLDFLEATKGQDEKYHPNAIRAKQARMVADAVQEVDP